MGTCENGGSRRRSAARAATARAFIQTACGADAELRSEVESFLAADAGRFAEQPPCRLCVHPSR